MLQKIWRVMIAIAIAITLFCQTTVSPALAQNTEKPNILVIWGDDIGWFNLSAYNNGMMGYRTPNLDRLAREGMRFTDYYGENSCTAGRAAFITGQSPFRTGLTKVGLPGSKLGLQPEDPTIAEILKPMGYATGQFGKNHLGDRDEFLPTNHGFDEFFGNLYHLNAEEEPEYPDYPEKPEFKQKYGPRGVLHSYAGGKIEDTGSLTAKRMETVDEEFLEAATNFMEQATDNNQPFFVWFNATRMHMNTHLKPESQGVTGYGLEADGMVEHDAQVGQLLDKLDQLEITDNTIVLYSTDNGAAVYGWPDSGMTPFHGMKDTPWEGGFRVPAIVRWPGHIPAATVSNEIMSALDWFPTLVAAAGESDIKGKLLKGDRAGNKKFKVHLDGYNFLPYLTGTVEEAPRQEFFYFTDDGDLAALRYQEWKALFLEQQATGYDVWQKPLTPLRAPYIFSLRRDPFERAFLDANNFQDWMHHHNFLLVPAQGYVAAFLNSFQEFPPRQKPASFSLDQALEKLTATSKN
ncbi:MAG TPA: arylsulfatase [Xenococcaceae cyanobacterium]